MAVAWAPDYVTSTDFANYVGVTLDSTVVAAAITTASRLVDDFTGRQYGQVASAEERFYTMRPDYRRCVYVADIDDLMETTDLVVELDDTATTDYSLEPRNANPNSRPWTRMVFDTHADVVSVTAIWGWEAVPEAVKAATLMQANRIAARRKSPFGIGGADVEGTPLRLQRYLDPDVQVVLQPYVRRGAVG